MNVSKTNALLSRVELNDRISHVAVTSDFPRATARESLPPAELS